MAKPMPRTLLLISSVLALACAMSLPAAGAKTAAKKAQAKSSATQPASITPAAPPAPAIAPQEQPARKYSPIQYCHGSSYPAVTWLQVRDFTEKHASATAATNGSKGRTTDPSLTTIPKLEYPESMRSSAPDGAVAVMVAVGKDGLPTDALVVCSTDPAFSEAARTAVKAAIFAPATRDGQPVEAVATLPIDFHP